MKSYLYMGTMYHKRTSFYYLDERRTQSKAIADNKKLKFKTHESICDYIDESKGSES
tara:strand:- start:87 stop:257 length:171 start_codon:yes stop_codon:yes gene_type:complete